MQLSPKAKDRLCWIAAVGLVALMFASCVTIVDPETGTGWNPIVWAVQMFFGAWLLFAAAYWVVYYLVYKPVVWLAEYIRTRRALREYETWRRNLRRRSLYRGPSERPERDVETFEFNGV